MPSHLLCFSQVFPAQENWRRAVSSFHVCGMLAFAETSVNVNDSLYML